MIILSDAQFQTREPLTEAYILCLVSLLHGRGQYLTSYVNIPTTFNMCDTVSLPLTLCQTLTGTSVCASKQSCILSSAFE
jgi:hypothetical protein